MRQSLALTFALLVTGCSRSAEPRPTANVDVKEPVEATQVAEAASPVAPTSVAGDAGPDAAGSGDSESAEASAGAKPAVPEKQTSEPLAPPDKLPAQARLRHAHVVWAVYFVIAKLDTPEMRKAKKRARAIGLRVDHQDLGCDLLVDPHDDLTPGGDDDYLLAAYYKKKADAKRVARAFGGKPWVGRVKTMCMD